MASYNPPTEALPIFDNAVFKSTNDSTILTVGQANLLYLRKTYADTATALETFSAGIKTNSIDPTTTTTTQLINSSMTSGDLYIGANVSANNARTGTIHIGDNNSILSGNGAVHINNGTSNGSNTQVMNGASTTGNLNLMTGATCSGAVNIQNGNSNAGIVNILCGQNCTGTLNIGNATLGTNTLPVNINTGNQTGTVTIGNSANTVQVNGSLTMGAGKNITLQPTASYVTPTADTMLGGLTIGTFTSFPSFPTSSSFTYGSISLVKGTYICFFSLQANTVTPTEFWINLGGTAVSTPSVVGVPGQYRWGNTEIIAGSIRGISGSFPINVTTAGTVTLLVTLNGTVTNTNVYIYHAVRIA